MNAAEIVRDAAAKSAVRRQYAEAHDCIDEMEQRLLLEGRDKEAADAHALALRVLRAYCADNDNPETRDRPCSVCGMLPCGVYAVTR